MLGIHHLGLAVSQLEESRSFFCDLLGWSEVRRDPAYPSVFVSNGKVMFTLWQTDEGAQPFDRRSNVGLHHVAIQVESEEELLTLYERLSDSSRVRMEFSPEPIRGGPVQHMICYDPSGIRVEFIWVPE